MHEAQISTKIGGKSQHYFHFIGRMKKDFPFYNWRIRPKLEVVAPDIVLRVFLLEQEKKQNSYLHSRHKNPSAHSVVLEIMSAQLSLERWCHYNSAISTLKDVILRTDPRNKLRSLRSLCFYLKEAFAIILTCPRGPKCTQPLTSQLVNECSLFFCQTTPTSGDKIEKASHARCVSACILNSYINHYILHCDIFRFQYTL